MGFQIIKRSHQENEFPIELSLTPDFKIYKDFKTPKLFC